jgi:hypothetical protein
MTVAIGRRKRNDDNKKLTRVISTKLSIENYNLSRVLTNIVYQYKQINEVIRDVTCLILPVVDGLRKQPGFSVLRLSQQD